MGKAVQYPGILAQPLDGQAVVFLVQEEAGLLTVLHIHLIAHAVFHDLHLGWGTPLR